MKIRLGDVDYERCQIQINQGKGEKDRIVPFPKTFKEVLAMHGVSMHQKNANYLFESSWKCPYRDRGIRKILTRHVKKACIARQISTDLAQETRH